MQSGGPGILRTPACSGTEQRQAPRHAGWTTVQAANVAPRSAPTSRAATPRRPAPAAPIGEEPRSGPRIVSLGAYCGVRKSVQKIGLDGEALPFDWMRTRIEGILHYVRSDFAGFFDYSSTQRVPNAPVVVYRDHLHSFWHDDLGDEQTMAKYRRRFARFKSLDASTKPILFVRSVAHTRELLLVDELLREITSLFGERAMLLVIVDFQRRTLGPVTLRDRKNLLVYYLPVDAHRDPGGAPYKEPLLCALDWLEGRPLEAQCVANERALLDMADISPEWASEGISPFAEPPADCHVPLLSVAPSAGAASQRHPGSRGGSATFSAQPPSVAVPQAVQPLALGAAPKFHHMHPATAGVAAMQFVYTASAVAKPAEHQFFYVSSHAPLQAAHPRIQMQPVVARESAFPREAFAGIGPTGLQHTIGVPIVCNA